MPRVRLVEPPLLVRILKKLETLMTRLAFTITVLGCALSSSPLHAQRQEWTWPEKPTNLQVLPKDWSGERLRPVMTGFTRALGVRCSYCHQGDESKPLSTYNFASDANPNKERAREMLRMLNDIETDLKKIQPSGDQRVNMWCDTCHRGRPRPLRLEDELSEAYRRDGLKAALLHYAELKTKFFGRGAYDFGERGLNLFGYEVLGKSDFQGAIQVFKMNAELFPDSANVWDSLGEAYTKAGNKALAQQAYSRSLAINPENQSAKDALERLKQDKPQ